MIPGSARGFCREITRDGAICTDRDDTTLVIAAGGGAISAPTTPALCSGASGAIVLGRLGNCRCDGSNVG